MERIDADGGVTPQVGGKRKRDESIGATVLREVSEEAVDLFVQGLGDRKVTEVETQPKKAKKTTREWFREAVGFLHNGNPNRGFFILQQLVREGDREAEIRTATCYFTGDGVARNRERAVSIWQKWAPEGDALSQANLSVALRHGMGVEKSVKLADYWTKQAKESHAKAKKET